MKWQKRISLNHNCTGDDMLAVKNRLMKQVDEQVKAGKITVVSQRVEVHFCVDFERLNP